jgi:hypothetical protein
MGRRTVPLAWAGVTGVGLIVVILVVSWQLFPRLTAAQTLVEDLNPAFTVDRVRGDRGGIEMVSAATNTADPMMYWDGAAAEMPKLAEFIAQRTSRSHDDVGALLRQDYPHITAFLTSCPLVEISAELPKLVHHLGTVLVMTLDEVDQMLRTDYPELHQAIVDLPKLAAGWDTVPGTEKLTRFDGRSVRTMPQLSDYLSQESGGWKAVPGTEKLTRFDGSPARSVDQVRDYFRDDVIPALERQQNNYQIVDTNWPPLTVFATLLTAVGVMVVGYGFLLGVLTRRQPRRQRDGPGPPAPVPDVPAPVGADLSAG